MFDMSCIVAIDRWVDKNNGKIRNLAVGLNLLACFVLMLKPNYYEDIILGLYTVIVPLFNLLIVSSGWNKWIKAIFPAISFSVLLLAYYIYLKGGL